MTDAPDFSAYHRRFNAMMSEYCGGRDSCHALALELIGQIVAGPKPIRVLDVGCGTGAFTEELYRQSGEYIAVCVDSSAKNLLVARHVLAGTTAIIRSVDITQPGWVESLEQEPFVALPETLTATQVGHRLKELSSRDVSNVARYYAAKK